jgi:hypothetical protein
MIAKLNESSPNPSNFKSSANGTGVRCCSRATRSNTDVIVDLTDMPMYSILRVAYIMPERSSDCDRKIGMPRRNVAIMNIGNASHARVHQRDGG